MKLIVLCVDGLALVTIIAMFLAYSVFGLQINEFPPASLQTVSFVALLLSIAVLDVSLWRDSLFLFVLGLIVFSVAFAVCLAGFANTSRLEDTNRWLGFWFTVFFFALLPLAVMPKKWFDGLTAWVIDINMQDRPRLYACELILTGDKPSIREKLQNQFPEALVIHTSQTAVVYTGKDGHVWLQTYAQQKGLVLKSTECINTNIGGFLV